MQRCLATRLVPDGLVPLQIKSYIDEGKPNLSLFMYFPMIYKINYKKYCIFAMLEWAAFFFCEGEGGVRLLKHIRAEQTT